MKFTSQHANSSKKTGFRSRFHALSGKLFDEALYDLVFSLAASIAESRQSVPLLISISGGQGSGKSTVTKLLAAVLVECFSRSTVILSLDDFYLQRSERERLARKVHPLLVVRGVPGTHDLALLADVIAGLKSGSGAKVPQFDKARDDRLPEVLSLPAAQVILCEGWCWGAVPEPESRLLAATNELERNFDPDCVWRQFVNQQLASYQSVFMADGFIFFQVPSFEAVFRWRWQQEVELAGSQTGGQRVMSEDEVREFISYYERLTRWMLEEMPGRADVIVHLNEHHRIQTTQYR